MTDQHNQDPYETTARVLIGLLIACSWIAAIAVALEVVQ